MGLPRRNSSNGPRRNVATKFHRPKRPETRIATTPISPEAEARDPAGCITSLLFDADGILIADEKPRVAGGPRRRRRAPRSRKTSGSRREHASRAPPM